MTCTSRLRAAAQARMATRGGCAATFTLAAVLSGVASFAAAEEAPGRPSCANTVTAKVVALEQVYYYNRFGSFNPVGLTYALRRDVVREDDKTAIPLKPDAQADGDLAGKVQLRADKRPRPLILRVNEGDCLKVTFTNLLARSVNGHDIIAEPSTGEKILIDGEEPATRHASMHVNGLNLVGDIMSDGSNVGRNPSSLAAPGETVTYTWYGKQEGGFLMYSMAGPAGGEGDGGQLGLGLFGSVNVEPKGARWYRSQVTAAELQAASTDRTAYGQPQIDYKAHFAAGPHGGEPVLSMLDAHREIIYSDLNAVVDVHPDGEDGTAGEDCKYVKGPGSVCGKPYREFTTIFHDEVTAIQAFPELDDETNPLHSMRDGMAINYGSSGLGAMVMANLKGRGPAGKCVECKLEEFFLSSWANGDPAMVVKPDPVMGLPRALYPDDPSNVHHSYMGDPVRFRSMHAGPKETHVFHLHAHQWVQDKHDPDSVYLDSQTLSPGAAFSYDIHYGGSGNRNFTVGDSIFHCHLYPHFAQGMWELWRSHDVFEAGTPDRNLPDAEIAGGTPNPAVVPLPRTPMPRMPTPEVKGYPFFIAGAAGHRPPQPPKDLDRDDITGEVSDGGLPRHRFEGPAERIDAAADLPNEGPAAAACQVAPTQTNLYDRGKANAACIAGRVRSLNSDPRFTLLVKKLKSASLKLFPYVVSDGVANDGSPEEKRAMDFHAGKLGTDGSSAIAEKTAFGWPAMGYATCDPSGRCDTPQKHVLFHVNGNGGAKPGAPYANPCPQEDLHERQYRAAYVQFDMTVNKFGWHDPQARVAVLENDVKETFSGDRPAEPLFIRAKSGECVVFKATNLVSSTLNVDDFQVASPTDVLGQHIHLVKFDVTSSDGSGNGWNYEDGTLSADEVRERISAYNSYQQAQGLANRLTPKVHRMFTAGPMAGDSRGICPPGTNATEWNSADMLSQHPFCGAQTTVQRWWADPLLNKKQGGQDRTLRTVFTHDHFGPSSHQHHGLYAALVIEPAHSTWQKLDGTPLATRLHEDGGPTSYSANILTPKEGGCTDITNAACLDKAHTAREFNLAFADFALVYSPDTTEHGLPRNQPLNAANRIDGNLPLPSFNTGTPAPEGISTKDPGSQLINYRNEPIPLRIGEQTVFAAGTTPPNPLACDLLPDGSRSCTMQRALDKGGDMADVFSSTVHKDQVDHGKATIRKPIFTEELGKGRGPGDPATPLLMAYAGDRVQVRLIQGAQEENHIFNMHGVKWLSQPESPNSGWMNAQPIGISEHFEFDVDIDPVSPQRNTDYLYSSTATDNLWDGQWGLLRAYSWKQAQPFLTRFPINPVVTQPPGLPKSGDACPLGTAERPVPQRIINVEARNAKVTYNRSAGLSDPNAIIFMRTRETSSAGIVGADKVECDQASAKMCSNTQDPEPLILRAAAGECITINLHNALDPVMPDTVRAPTDCKAAEYAASWSFNTMPPTTKGFNFNQFVSSNRVSLHPQLVAVNGLKHDGSHVGDNQDTTVPPGGTRQFSWYAGGHAVHKVASGDGKYVLENCSDPTEFGVVALRDMGDVVKHSSHGAIGALVIEPAGSHWEVDRDPATNLPHNASATVTYKKQKMELTGGADGCPKTMRPKEGVKSDGVERSFRDFVLLYQDDVSLTQHGAAVPNLRNADDAEDTGQKAFNYRTEPMWARYGSASSAEPEVMGGNDYSNAFSSRVVDGACQNGRAPGQGCDPETPVFTARAGAQVRFRVVHAAGHPRNHAFALFGHDWIMNPFVCGTQSKIMGWSQTSSNRIGVTGGIGPARHINVLATAGGDFHVPGDYLYRTQEGFMFSGGLWGLFRVTPEVGGWHPADARTFCP